MKHWSRAAEVLREMKLIPTSIRYLKVALLLAQTKSLYSNFNDGEVYKLKFEIQRLEAIENLSGFYNFFLYIRLFIT